MSEETLINSLAVIGGLTVCYLVVRLLAAIAGWAQRTAVDPPPTAAAPAAAPGPASPLPSVPPPEADLTEEIVAVMTAAVHAAAGAHHIVHIRDVHSGQTWSSEGRWIHQTSHRPH